MCNYFLLFRVEQQVWLKILTTEILYENQNLIFFLTYYQGKPKGNCKFPFKMFPFRKHLYLTYLYHAIPIFI
jgi:hypothetical protein